MTTEDPRQARIHQILALARTAYADHTLRDSHVTDAWGYWYLAGRPGYRAEVVSLRSGELVVGGSIKSVTFFGGPGEPRAHLAWMGRCDDIGICRCTSCASFAATRGTARRWSG